MLRDVILWQKAELERVLSENYIAGEVEPFSLENNDKGSNGPQKSGKIFFCVVTQQNDQHKNKL